jgi:purine-binding chemotaxis protein CheW
MTSAADARVGVNDPSRSRAAELDVLLFELAEQRFALRLADVLEVVRAVALRPLPNAPAVVEGIIDVRGDIVPVLDIRARFGLAPKPIALTDHFVLGSAGARRLALRVDRATDMARVPFLDVHDAVNLPRGVAHIAGVASLPDGLVLLNDLPSFLFALESEQLDAALAELPAAAPEALG